MAGQVIRIDRGSPSDRIQIAATLRRLADEVELGRISNVAIAHTVDDEGHEGCVGIGVMWVDDQEDFVALLGALAICTSRAVRLFEETSESIVR